VNYSSKHKTHVSGQAPFSRGKLGAVFARGGAAEPTSGARHLREYALLRAVLPSRADCALGLQVPVDLITAWDEGRELRALRHRRRDVTRLRKAHETGRLDGA
jgi:hypothetical protein